MKKIIKLASIFCALCLANAEGMEPETASPDCTAPEVTPVRDGEFRMELEFPGVEPFAFDDEEISNFLFDAATLSEPSFETRTTLFEQRVALSAFSGGALALYLCKQLYKPAVLEDESTGINLFCSKL